jgi:hypothetical protein
MRAAPRRRHHRTGGNNVGSDACRAVLRSLTGFAMAVASYTATAGR